MFLIQNLPNGCPILDMHKTVGVIMLEIVCYPRKKVTVE